MAEAFFLEAIKNDPVLAKHFTVSSAGLAAIDGAPPSMNSIQVLKEDWGIDVTNHKAKLINYEDIKSAYLILTMTSSQKYAIIRLFPETKTKVFTLKEYAQKEAGHVNNNKLNEPFDNDSENVLNFGLSYNNEWDCDMDFDSALGSDCDLKCNLEYDFEYDAEDNFCLYSNKENYIKNKEAKADIEFDMDIIDPYGMPISVYRQCSEEIRLAIDNLIERLKSEIKK